MMVVTAENLVIVLYDGSVSKADASEQRQPNPDSLRIDLETRTGARRSF
jgi:hypothetical protein